MSSVSETPRTEPTGFSLPAPVKTSTGSGLEQIQQLLHQKLLECKADSKKVAVLERIKANTERLQSIPGFEEDNHDMVESLRAHLALIGTGVPDADLIFQASEMISTAMVTKEVANTRIPLAHGKVKDIWVRGSTEASRHVYSTPREGSGTIGKIEYARHEAELREELATAVAIRETLKEKARQSLIKDFQTPDPADAAFLERAVTDDQYEQLATYLESRGRPAYALRVRELKGVGPGGRHLAIDFEEVSTPEEKIQGKFTLRSEKATGDLEARLGSEQALVDPLGMGEQFLHGMADLHATGRVHGDAKPENVFLYGDRLKIADFGKARPMAPQETAMYTGNPRYEPPEGRLSLKGEVYSAGIVLIRILEKNFLTTKKPALLPVDAATRKPIPPEARRQGVERYLIEHPGCTQTETGRLKAKFTVYGRRMFSSITNPSEKQLSQAETAIQGYIKELGCRMTEQLITELKAKGWPEGEAKNKAEKAIEPLITLLGQMTQADTAKRPIMAQAHEKYDRIRRNIDTLRRTQYGLQTA